MGWGSGNLGGGSGGLNFKIVGGTSEPSNPKENTIWVNTDADITSWIFCVDEPAEPVDGMVWITTGTSSAVAFNALKKNVVTVYPLSAKQYVSGALVDKTAKTWDGSKWVDWFVWDGTLFPESPGIVEITGGWVNDPNITHMSRTNVDSSTVTEDAITIHITGSNKCTNLATAKEIDLTGFSYLKFNVTERSGSAEGICVVYKDGAKNPSEAAAESIFATVGERTIELPAGGGLYRIAFIQSTSSSTRSYKVSNVRLME